VRAHLGFDLLKGLGQEMATAHGPIASAFVLPARDQYPDIEVDSRHVWTLPGWLASASPKATLVSV
jgi:hypothetical protein